MFNAIAGMYLGQALGLIEQEKRRKADAEKARRNKIRIRDANTTRPGVESSTMFALPFWQLMALVRYLEELRQQAIWDAEKCAKQQSKNI